MAECLKRHCAERGSGYSNFCLCWDMEQYQPEEVPGTVITRWDDSI